MKTAHTRSTAFGGLFEVSDGIAFEAAIEEAANLTEGVIDIAKGVACNIKRDQGAAELWAGIHCLETVAALLEAIQGGLLELERPEPTPAPDAKPDGDYDENGICRCCGATEGATHAHWCKTGDCLDKWSDEQEAEAAALRAFGALEGVK